MTRCLWSGELIVSCYSVMRVASSSAHLVCRLREVNEQLSRVSAGEARALFEQEVGAHTHTEWNSFSLLYFTVGRSWR